MPLAVLPREILEAVVSATDHDGLPLSIRTIRLPHPRTSVPALFLCGGLPNSSSSRHTIYELQAVNPPDPRSWFVGDSVISDGKLLMATAIDPTFLLIPILQNTYPVDGSVAAFRPADDIFEEAVNDPKQANLNTQDIAFLTSLPCARDALAHLCETKVISVDLTVYRFSPACVLEYLRKKVARLAQCQVQDCSQTLVRGFAKDGLMEDGREQLLELGRTKTACNMVAQYIPESFRTQLLASYDFSKLDEHLLQLQTEAMEVAPVKPTKSKSTAAKKSTTAASDTKKRKSTKPSVGVDKLMKANVTGMPKISSFFKKA